jgi:hypothetical protein
MIDDSEDDLIVLPDTATPASQFVAENTEAQDLAAKIRDNKDRALANLAAKRRYLAYPFYFRTMLAKMEDSDSDLDMPMFE